LDSVTQKIDNITVIGIAGPGDPFANPEETITTLSLVRERYPDKLLCVATNGLGLAEQVERLAPLNVSHVTITLNAVDPAIGAKIYPWVRFGPKVYRGIEGAEVLLHLQVEGIKILKAMGITVKINTVIVPGINDFHAADVAACAAELGADIQNCIPLMRAEGAVFENISPPPPEMMGRLRIETGKYLPQMCHCSRCRADAAGLLGEENSFVIEELLKEASFPRPGAKKPYVAVASMEGILVNRHLGEAPFFWICNLEDGEVVMREQRPSPIPGQGDRRWEDLAETLSDCRAVLVQNCGPNPKRILERRGIPVIAAEGLISETALPILEGRPIPPVFTALAGRCGAGLTCTGTGAGCG
jgi:nitrogen fixation protein NifB